MFVIIRLCGIFISENSEDQMYLCLYLPQNLSANQMKKSNLQGEYKFHPYIILSALQFNIDKFRKFTENYRHLTKNGFPPLLF